MDLRSSMNGISSDYHSAHFPGLPVQKILRDIIKKHKRVIFNGDNYTESWVKEAEKCLDRGQPGIAGSYGIGSTLFNVLEKGPDQADVEILDRKVRRL